MARFGFRQLLLQYAIFYGPLLCIYNGAYAQYFRQRVKRCILFGASLMHHNKMACFLRI